MAYFVPSLDAFLTFLTLHLTHPSLDVAKEAMIDPAMQFDPEIDR